MLNMSKSIIHEHFVKLGYINRFDVWVPHDLTEKNLIDCISICDSLYVGRLISLINFHEMALQSIWWRDISRLFEPLQVKFQPERTHSSRLTVIWSRLSQNLQNTHWWRQWLPHLTRISSHRAKFLSLGTERSHTGSNPENRVNEESIHNSIRSFVIATIDLWDGALSMEEHFFARQSRFKWLPNVNYASFLAEIWPEEVRRVDLSRCRVIKWILAPFHGNLPNLSNDRRINATRRYYFWSK